MSIRSKIAASLHPHLRAQLIEWEFALQKRLRAQRWSRTLRPVFLRRYLRRPEEIDIEVTSSCDADCIMCPRRSMQRKQGPMSFDLFKKVVDEAVSLGVPKLVLNGYGEISVLKNCDEYLAYIRSKSKSIKIAINSNGMRMDERIAQFYLNHRVDVVNVTIDGATAETFESIRRYLKLDVVERNVRNLIAARNRSGQRYPLVSVHMIVMPQNQHEAEQFLKKWDGVADQVGLAGFVTRLGSVTFVKPDTANWERTPCFNIWDQLSVLSDGTVALCCDDWDGKGHLGNVKDSTVSELWNDPIRLRYRLTHLSGKASTIPLCDACRQPRRGPWWFAQ